MLDTTEKPALMIDGPTVLSGRLRAVDGLLTGIEDGRLRVILGPNGAERTTMMRPVTGRTRVTAGHVHLHGEDITSRAEHETARAGVARPSRDAFTIVENGRVVAVGAVEGLADDLVARDTTI